MLLSGIMLPMTLGPRWLQDAAKITPYGYISNAMRDVSWRTPSPAGLGPLTGGPAG